MQLRILILSLILAFKLELAAQENLSLDSAIQKALLAGDAILIAESELRAAELQQYRGNAGETPRTAFTLNDNAQVINISQELASGATISRDAAVANNLGAALNVNWTVFNGMRVKAIKGRIGAQIDERAHQLRASMQATVAEVMTAYYSLARQQQYLKVIGRSSDVSEKRLELIQQRKLVGLANGAELLQAEIDAHQRVQALESQRLVARQMQFELNNLMQAPMASEWIIPDSFPLQDLSWEDIDEGIRSNPELAAADAAIRAADFSARSVYANRMPTVGFNGGLGYNLLLNNGGFILRNQNYGPYLGVNAQVPILQHRVFERQHQVAQQEAETIRLRKGQAENALLTSALSLYATLETYTALANEEKVNVEKAKRLLEIVEAREAMDAATIVELREAQRSFEEANFRLIDLRFQALMSQVELMRLSGKLLE